MKVFTSQQIRDIDLYTITNEPISSVDLMERASIILFNWIVQNISTNRRIIAICGPGNNGGDGLAIARLLYETGFNIDVYYLLSESYSVDFKTNLDRLKSLNITLKNISTEGDFPIIHTTDAVIDALYGSGLSKPIEGINAKLVEHINKYNPFVISVDIPSGLFCNENPFPNTKPVVKANICLTLQFPKLSFLFAENEEYIKKWQILPIGLHPQRISEIETPYYYTEISDIQRLIKTRPTFSHKGTYGHCLIIAGSYGMMGAASLCALSAVKSGLGLVTMHIPKCGYSIAQQLVPMAMCTIDKNEQHFTAIDNIDKFSSICIGPGLGTKPETAVGFIDLIRRINIPLLLDADALNIISEHKEFLEHLPSNTIITPHPGEFDRLFGKSSCGFERMQKAIKASKRYRIVIVLKGAFTQVISPNGDVRFNSTGNPGMATGGSGDVLSGIITGLLAQDYSPIDSAVLGVYLHGLAGDIAEMHLGQASLSAENIIEYLPLAFKRLCK